MHHQKAEVPGLPNGLKSKKNSRGWHPCSSVFLNQSTSRCVLTSTSQTHATFCLKTKHPPQKPTTSLNCLSDRISLGALSRRPPLPAPASVSPSSPAHLLCAPAVRPTPETRASPKPGTLVRLALCSPPSFRVTIWVPRHRLRNPSQPQGPVAPATPSPAHHTCEPPPAVWCGGRRPSRCLESGRGGEWASLSVTWVSVTPSFLTARSRVLGRRSGRMGPQRRGGC